MCLHLYLKCILILEYDPATMTSFTVLETISNLITVYNVYNVLQSCIFDVGLILECVIGYQCLYFCRSCLWCYIWRKGHHLRQTTKDDHVSSQPGSS